MAKTINKEIHAEAVRRRKVETTYEYVPILGEILGFWRRVAVNRPGEEVELHINTPLTEYDRLIVNGKEIVISDKK
jgi:hypothetical protein